MALPRLTARLTAHLSRQIPSLKNSKVQRFAREAKATSYLLFLFLSCGVPSIIFLNDHILRVEHISGASMYPYLNNNIDSSTQKDIALVRKWNATKDLKRGTIISMFSPFHPDQPVVKRIIGLPGDRVAAKPPYPDSVCVVPKGHVWVEGDGRHFGKLSLDSNYYGPVSERLILGKLVFVLFPWSAFGAVGVEGWKGRTKVEVVRDGRKEGEWKWD